MVKGCPQYMHVNVQSLHDCITSHSGLSEIQTASIQQSNSVLPIDFAIEIMHFNLWEMDLLLCFAGQSSSGKCKQAVALKCLIQLYYRT